MERSPVCRCERQGQDPEQLQSIQIKIQARHSEWNEIYTLVYIIGDALGDDHRC